VTDQTETARALLWRHQLPEDVIDGALCLHAQELAATIRSTDLPDWSDTTDLFDNGATWAADLIDPTVPDALAGTANAEQHRAVPPAVPAPATDRAEDPIVRRERYATAISRWHRDPEQELYTQGAEAVIAIADAEQTGIRAAALAEAVTAMEALMGDGEWEPGALVECVREMGVEAAPAVLPATVGQAELTKQIDLRDYWHGEAMSATTRIIELEGQLEESRRAAVAPVDRATVLNEAAQHLYTALFPAVYADMGQKAAEGVNRAVSELRRLAVEADGPWLVQKICCGRDDGTVEFATWEKADRFREEYVDSARIADHERSAIVRAVAVEARDGQTAQGEAHPPRHVWEVESPRRDNWASWGTTYDEREWAQERYESAIEHAGRRPFRLVRATTTYTVEAEHQPATGPAGGAQQPEPIVTVHAAPDLSPAAQEALGALAEVAKRRIIEEQ